MHFMLIKRLRCCSNGDDIITSGQLFSLSIEKLSIPPSDTLL